MNRGTTREHIDAVVAIEDRVLRNYWVTQTYADLSSALGALLAPDTCNWQTFAVWASRTVGAGMRGEALPRWLHDRVLLPDGLMGAVAATTTHHGWSAVSHVVGDLTPEHLLDVTRELLGQMALNLSNGNTEVFAEIAPPGADFVAAFGAPGVASAAARATVLEACEGAVLFEGVNHLREGYARWCDAMDEDDPVRRSQLVLAGSVHLGVHEQSHLQPVLAASMDMGVNQSLARLKARLRRDAPSLDATEATLDEVLAPAARGVGDLWDDVMTATLGTLTSPEGTLRLDHDVPVRAGEPFTPSDLREVVVDDLAALLRRFSHADAEGRDSRAVDWVNFDDRMNFIANLFLSRHHDPALFAAPFDEATLAALEADRVPAPTVAS